MYNPNWYFNPQCFNQQTYYEFQQQMQQYQQSQNKEVEKAFHAYKDFLDAYSKLDSAHQQELFVYCLSDFANRNHWQNN